MRNIEKRSIFLEVEKNSDSQEVARLKKAPVFLFDRLVVSFVGRQWSTGDSDAEHRVGTGKKEWGNPT